MQPLIGLSVVVTSLILTDLFQLDEIDKFVDNLQHVCGVLAVSASWD